MKLSTTHPRWLVIFVGCVALILVSHWTIRQSVEQAIADNFRQKLSDLPQTQITYDIDKTQIEWWKRRITLQAVELKIRHEEESTGDTTAYRLSFPRFSIHISSIWDLLFHHTLGIEEISVYQPQIQVFLPATQDSVRLQQEVGDLQQETLWFLKQLNVKHFELLHGALQLSVDGVPEPRYSLRDISVYMNNLDIDVDSLSAEHITELMITQHIEVVLNNEVILLPDAQHTLHFKELKISSAQDAILIDSLHLFSSLNADTVDNRALDNNIKIPQLHLKGVDFLSLYLDNKLFIDTVLVGKTDLNLIVENNSISIIKPLDDKKNHGLDSIHIGQLQMMPGTIAVHYANDSLTNTFQVDSAALLLGNVTRSSSDSTFSWDAEKLELQLQNYQAKLADKHYTFSFDKLNWTLKDKSFGLEGVTILPTHDTIPMASARPLKYLKVPSFTIRQIDFTDLIFKHQLNSKSIDIESPTIGLVVSDHPSSAKKSPVNITEVAQHFFKTFKLGRLALKNANVALYHNQGPAFLTLENIGIYGHDWEMVEDESIIKEFPLEAYFEKGSLTLPAYQINLLNAHYTNTKDSLTAQQIDVQPTSPSDGLQARVQLQEVSLVGLLSMPASNQLGLLNIGNARAKIILPETIQENNAPNPTPQLFQVQQLKIDHLDAEIEKADMGKFSLQNLKADLKGVILGGTSLPFSFEMDSSQLQLGTTSFTLKNLGGGLDSLHLRAGNMALYNIAAASDSTSQTQWQFTLPMLEIDRLQFPDEENTAWYIGQIALRQPTAKGVLPLHSADTTATSGSTDAPAQASSFHLLLDTLLVDQLQWTLEQSTKEDTIFWTSEYLTLKGYHLQYPLEKNELMNQDIILEVSNLQQKSQDTHWRAGKVGVSMKDQTVAVHDIQLNTQTATAQLPSVEVEATLAGFQLKTKNANGWALEQPWIVEELLVSQPELSLSWDSVSEVSVVATKPKNRSDFPMPSIAVSNFQLKGADFKAQGLAEQPSIRVEGIDFTLKDIFWDTKDSLDMIALLRKGSWEVKIAHPQISFPYPPAQAHVYGLQFQNDPSNLRWDSVQWSPTIDPFEYSNYLTHQKSYLSVVTGAGIVQGLQWDALTDASFLAKKIQIRQPIISIFRDKRLPFPENHYPPMLHEMLVNLPYAILIDTIELHDGYIDIRIQPEQGEKLGLMHFSNVEGIVSNVTNMPERIQENGIMRSDTYASIQGAGLLKTHIDFDLDDPHYTFFMDVNVGKLDLRKLNSVVESVASVRVKSGHMRKLNFKAIGNDEFAYGNMDFMYRKLHLSILSKKDHEHQGPGLAIESFLANNLILRRNNDHPFPHRQGQVFAERDKTRQIFQYWAKIAVSGILTSAGVKSNRNTLKKQFDRKRKLLEQEMKEDVQVAAERE